MQADRDILRAGLQDLAIKDIQIMLDPLLDFLELMQKWNKTYNLTSIRSSPEMVRLHLLDSLAIFPYLRGPRIVDIGTGAGVPGIPLAIAAPDMEFILLDSNAKKTRFVQQVILELQLKNVSIYHGRVEDFQSRTKFNTIISRAFSSLQEFVVLTCHLLEDEGTMLAMKGRKPERELAQIVIEYALIPIKVPGVDAERCLIQIEKRSLEKSRKSNMSGVEQQFRGA
jgi:16S rRNA (guanine527-N7)-methyltransferase